MARGLKGADMDPLIQLSLRAQASRLAAGTVTSAQLTEAHLARIAAREADIRAWEFIDP